MAVRHIFLRLQSDDLNAKKLNGIDISAGMLDQARWRRIYDELVECVLTGFLTGQPDSSDLIVASDTFNYFGDLSELFSAVHTSLRPSGWAVFTLEQGSDQCGFELCTHGRYSHSEQNLRGSLAAAQLGLRSLSRATLRIEDGEPVSGFVVSARKPASTG